MAESYTLDTFAPHVGTSFNVRQVEGGFAIRLADAYRSKVFEGQPRDEPFTLVFTSPPGPHLPQGLFNLEHDELGEVEIFLVPIGPETAGGDMRYEAIFN